MKHDTRLTGNRHPAGYQCWRDLLFVHWPVPPEALRPLVPRELEIDLFAGQAYVALGSASAGTRDHFSIERYNLYVARRGELFRGRVRHEPYPLRRATVVHMSQTMLNAAGLPTPTDAPFSHYSRGETSTSFGSND